MRRGDKVLKALKRENERLRKELGRLEALVSPACDDELPDEMPRKQKKKSPKSPGCPSCEGELSRVQLGSFDYDFCSCGYRKKVS